MAKPTAKKPVPKKTTATPPPSAPPQEPSKLLLVLDRIKARLPALTPAERNAFHSLMTDPQRTALGARTKGQGVAGDAVSWIVQIDKDAREYPALFDFYSKERFAYFVECTRALVERLLAERGNRATKGAVVAGAASASDTAKALRKSLVRRMEAFAGDRGPERDALTAALGSIVGDDNLASSIQKLVTLARTWIARDDASSKFLAAAAKLTAAFCDETLHAGEALTGAAAEDTGAGREPSRDSPAVNVREGAVLREMREAMAALDEAHEVHGTIRKLTPGPATRAVLGSRKAAPAVAPTTAPATAANGAPSPA